METQWHLCSELSRMFDISNKDKHQSLQIAALVPNIFYSSSNGSEPKWRVINWNPKNGDHIATLERGQPNLSGNNYSEIHFGLFLPDAKIGLELVDELESFIYSTEQFLEWMNYEFQEFLKVDFSSHVFPKNLETHGV